MTILVTGSTGHLGTPTLAALRTAGADAHGISRSGRGDSLVADLLTGDGVDAAFRGVDTVVHCAQTMGKRDLEMARNLTDASRRAGVKHLVLISIVGIERIPLGYYRQRVEIEHIVEASGVPFTIQRATQFHSLVDTLFSAQRLLPVILVPAVRFQSIAVGEVAARLAELAQGNPRTRVPDIGGPQQLGIRELHEQWRKARGSRRPALRLRLPGKLFRALDDGANLVPGDPFGRQTFDEYVRATYRPGA